MKGKRKCDIDKRKKRICEVVSWLSKCSTKTNSHGTSRAYQTGGSNLRNVQYLARLQPYESTFMSVLLRINLDQTVFECVYKLIKTEVSKKVNLDKMSLYEKFFF